MRRRRHARESSGLGPLAARLRLGLGLPFCDGLRWHSLRAGPSPQSRSQHRQLPLHLRNRQPRLRELLGLHHLDVAELFSEILDGGGPTPSAQGLEHGRNGRTPTATPVSPVLLCLDLELRDRPGVLRGLLQQTLLLLHGDAEDNAKVAVREALDGFDGK